MRLRHELDNFSVDPDPRDTDIAPLKGRSSLRPFSPHGPLRRISGPIGASRSLMKAIP